MFFQKSELLLIVPQYQTNITINKYEVSIIHFYCDSRCFLVLHFKSNGPEIACTLPLQADGIIRFYFFPEQYVPVHYNSLMRPYYQSSPPTKITSICLITNKKHFSLFICQFLVFSLENPRVACCVRISNYLLLKFYCKT